MFKYYANAALESAVNAYLRLDPETIKRLQALAGKVVRIELQGWGIDLYIMPSTNGLRFFDSYAGQIDAHIKGSAFALLRQSRRPPAEAAAEDISIEGDTELGQAIHEILHNIHIDWEYYLSRLVGDTIARRAGNVAHGIREWGQATKTNLQQNITEYLQEEIRYFPPREEMEDFIQAVDQLRDDVARLEARLVLKIKADNARGKR